MIVEIKKTENEVNSKEKALLKLNDSFYERMKALQEKTLLLIETVAEKEKELVIKQTQYYFLHS